MSRLEQTDTRLTTKEERASCRHEEAGVSDASLVAIRRDGQTPPCVAQLYCVPLAVAQGSA